MDSTRRDGDGNAHWGGIAVWGKKLRRDAVLSSQGNRSANK